MAAQQACDVLTALQHLDATIAASAVGQEASDRKQRSRSHWQDSPASVLPIRALAVGFTLVDTWCVCGCVSGWVAGGWLGLGTPPAHASASHAHFHFLRLVGSTIDASMCIVSPWPQSTATVSPLLARGGAWRGGAALRVGAVVEVWRHDACVPEKSHGRQWKTSVPA